MFTFYMATWPEIWSYWGMGGEYDPQGPALLVSHHFINVQCGYDGWPGEQSRMWRRTWCLDSGGFSAFTTGVTIDLDEYIRRAGEQLSVDPTLDFVFTLDNISSWRETLANTERMWAAGVPAVPVYHVGEPEDVLRGYAQDYPKIALGGMVPLRKKDKLRWVQQCFARVWPKAVHGLGAGSRDIMQCVPWHSVDASNWASPARFGNWEAFGKQQLHLPRGRQSNQRRHPVTGAAQNNISLRPEVDHCLRLEQETQRRWSKELEEVRSQLSAAGWRRP